MKNLSKRIRKQAYRSLAVLGAMGVLLTGCSKEDVISNKNKVSFYATDAPIDNAEVEAVFVTVSELRVDGQKVEGFQKTTLELTALTNGKTQLLEEAEIDANSINSVEVVMDFEADANGNFPGSYVLTTDGRKEAIASSETNLVLFKSLEIESEGDNQVVLDFDLRKMLKEENDGDFELVTTAELESSIRVVMASKTGTIEGTLDSMEMIRGKAVAYLYAEGEFTKAEMQASGQSGVEFANAVNSATLSSNGDFKISFAEEGEYEIHIFEYDDTNNDGKLEIVGEIDLQSALGGDVDIFSVGANSSTKIALGVNAILPL